MKDSLVKISLRLITVLCVGGLLLLSLWCLINIKEKK